MRELSGLLTRLNVSTRQWHAQGDEPWLELLRPTVSRADYLAQLVHTYGFVAPFESACKYTPKLEHALDFRQFTRAGLLAQDLLGLGLSAAQVASIPQCEEITSFGELAEALGWLYVIERSMLLHDGVRRHLIGHIPELAPACAYLSHYAGRISEHWTSFGRLLDRIAPTPDTAERVIGAAHTAFATAQQWFGHRRSVTRSSA